MAQKLTICRALLEALPKPEVGRGFAEFYHEAIKATIEVQTDPLVQQTAGELPDKFSDATHNIY